MATRSGRSISLSGRSNTAPYAITPDQNNLQEVRHPNASESPNPSRPAATPPSQVRVATRQRSATQSGTDRVRSIPRRNTIAGSSSLPSGSRSRPRPRPPPPLPLPLPLPPLPAPIPDSNASETTEINAQPRRPRPPLPILPAYLLSACTSDVPEVQTNAEFIKYLSEATMEQSGLSKEQVYRIRNPKPPPLEYAQDVAFIHCARDYHTASSARKYKEHEDAYRARHPEETYYSHHTIEKMIGELTGVVPLRFDMCPDSHIAYTGKYKDLDECTYCPKSRWDPDKLRQGKQVPARQFVTIPVGFVLQALFGSDETAKAMRYFVEQLEALADQADESGCLPRYYDTCCGEEFRNMYADGRIQVGDVILQMSIDGAQLFRDKASDCWIYMFVVHNLSPDYRYKKRFVIPGGFVPGPNHPKNIESFVFPGLYHIAALQKEGFSYWDASLAAKVTQSWIWLALETADGPAMADIAGTVGHHGKFGCRRFCPMPTRHRERDGHYYPVMQQPGNGYSVRDCSHNDVTFSDLSKFRETSSQCYYENLQLLCSSRNANQHAANRLETGLVKPSILLGVPLTIDTPGMFTLDIMHLLDLNDPDLFISLWQKKLKSYGSDEGRESWDWGVLIGEDWEVHGEQVALSTAYIPAPFGRATRDPAQKINSGYKAWEFGTWMYCVAPAFLRHILPEKYWRNYCMLVRGIRLAKQYTISREEMIELHRLLLTFVKDFETLYVQRNPDRLHFVRQSIHVLTHLGPEIFRLGPLTCYAQWVMETLIGNLGQEIGSLVDPDMNIANRGLVRAQMIALYATVPEIVPESDRLSAKRLPRHAVDLGEGYVFLPRKDSATRAITTHEQDALATYWTQQGWPNAGKFCNYVRRRGKLLLPNDQKVRSVWNEELSKRKDRRRSTIAKFYENGKVYYGEVQYYFLLCFPEQSYPLAMVSVFSEPDQDLLEKSYKTVYLCRYQGQGAMKVIGVKQIKALVGMVPDFRISAEKTTITPPDLYFLVEKPSLQGQEFFGLGDVGEQEDDDDDDDELDAEQPGETDAVGR
ncbi:hypothetical protein V5O48_010665 [Marasmius crinis-equi]|uniref:Uncharacterized protein n=1 Tax=Marasmius crinis-equi TaxID=585013 RepID=A0ABR3F7S6_9AGAR